MSTHYKGTENEVRALEAFVKFVRAYDSMRIRIDCLNTTGELTDTQFGVLEALYHLGALHQNDLGEKLLTSKSNVVAVVDRLEGIGMVERRRSTEDRRYVFIHLTETGRDAVEEILPVHVAAITEEMSSLTAEEQIEFGRLCKKLGLKEALKA